MGKAKPNPRRVPRTQADVDRAEREGMNRGAEFMANAVLYILKDKHGAEDDDIRQLAAELQKVVEEINEGRITRADIERVVRREYYVEVSFK